MGARPSSLLRGLPLARHKDGYCRTAGASTAPFGIDVTFDDTSPLYRASNAPLAASLYDADAGEINPSNALPYGFFPSGRVTSHVALKCKDCRKYGFPRGASANFCDPYRCTCNMARRKKAIVSFVDGGEREKHARRATGGEPRRNTTRADQTTLRFTSQSETNRIVIKRRQLSFSRRRFWCSSSVAGLGPVV